MSSQIPLPSASPPSTSINVQVEELLPEPPPQAQQSAAQVALNKLIYTEFVQYEGSSSNQVQSATLSPKVQVKALPSEFVLSEHVAVVKEQDSHAPADNPEQDPSSSVAVES